MDRLTATDPFILTALVLIAFGASGLFSALAEGRRPIMPGLMGLGAVLALGFVWRTDPAALMPDKMALAVYRMVAVVVN